MLLSKTHSLEIPTSRRIAGLIVGLLISGFCLIHLVSDTSSERGAHDYVIGIITVVGLGLAFPDQLPITGMISAYRRRKDEE